MTKEQANSLRIGDIIEHVTAINYWLGKLTERNGNGDWKTKNLGDGSSTCLVMQYPENFHLVGHSDIP